VLLSSTTSAASEVAVDPEPLDRMKGLGASLHPGGATFSVWAPRCRSVEVVVDGRRPVALHAEDDGLFEVTLDGVADTAQYRYRLNGGQHRPDPVSRYQAQGVHGPSVVVDPDRFAWTDSGFRGHALADLVIYELHVGTFTTTGTFEAVIPHLSRLVDLGITALELMPVAEFPGSRNWGYDGVHLYAPQSTYGGPRGLRRLVDAAHAAGLSVILDVVYNHLGPEGNYLGEYGPYFTDRYRTPWGTAVNFDGPDAAGVRRHFVENARYWVREFHVDGLRLDAIHSIYDASPVHVLTELAEAAREEGRLLGRPVHISAESHDNDRNLVLGTGVGGMGLDAVWADDFHHALHVTLTGERDGYYADFGRPGQLARALAEGFAFQGEPSEYFGRPRGTPSADLDGQHFVICVQNHDQVGNRAGGERFNAIVPFAAAKLAAGLLFAAPALPLLFMGEEYGETAPFQFFTSYLDPALAEAVRRGRTQEFEKFAWRGEMVPDPGAPGTFVRSRLNHSLVGAPRHRELREYYRRWLAVRAQHPALGAHDKQNARVELDGDGAVLTLTRTAKSGESVQVIANLTGQSHRLPGGRPSRVLIDSDDVAFAGTGGAAPLGPYQVLLCEVRR
jgi:maltooligosyltrehalose trehalohydrolase